MQKTGRGWYPAATHKPIAAGPNDPIIVPSMAILHVAVSHAASLFDFFKYKSGGIESHFYVRLDGTVEQYRSVLREADANYRANSYLVGQVRYGAVSIETAGFATGKWNLAQMVAIKDLLLWLHKEHGVRLTPVSQPQPDLAHGGVSYHTKFKSWSNVAGKTCPGPGRIMQYAQDIVPWMKSITDCTHCPVHCPKES